MKPSNDSETDMTGANYPGTHFWVKKTSYATAEDSDSERAKNQSGSEAAERQRSGHVVHMTGAQLSK